MDFSESCAQKRTHTELPRSSRKGQEQPNTGTTDSARVCNPMIHTQRTIGLRVNSQARVHDMRNVQASIACIGSSLQEMQTEKSQTVVVRSTETGLVEDSKPDVGERHERNAQYGCLRSGSVVLPSFPPRESGGVVQPRRDSPAVQPQLKPVVEHDSTLKSVPFEELPIARSEWFSPGSMTRSRFKKISVHQPRNRLGERWRLCRRRTANRNLHFHSP